jgi:hypothetical protein
LGSWNESEPVPFGAHQAVASDRQPVEVQRSAPDRAAAEIIETGTADVPVVELDIERAYSSRTRPAGAGQHEDGVRIHAEGDGSLLPGESPAFAGGNGAHRQPRRVRPVTRFGNSDGRNVRAVGDVRKPTVLLVARRMPDQDVSHERGEDDEVRRVEVGSADLLGGHPGEDRARGLTAVAFGDSKPGQTDARHVGHQLRPQLRRPVVSLVVRREGLRAEAAQLVTECRLCVVPREVHGHLPRQMMNLYSP